MGGGRQDRAALAALAAVAFLLSSESPSHQPSPFYLHVVSYFLTRFGLRERAGLVALAIVREEGTSTKGFVLEGSQPLTALQKEHSKLLRELGSVRSELAAKHTVKVL